MVVFHYSCLLVTLIYYAILAASFYGWGLAALKLQRYFNSGFWKLEATWTIWLGFAIWLLILQLLHLIVPLRANVVVPLLVTGVAMAAMKLLRQRRDQPWSKWPFNNRKAAYSALFLGLILLWIASRAMLHPTNYDSGLYHMSAIRWINSYPIVPGLGNLHGRLAFNQSFFTYVAALNLYPYFGHGRSIANSFLLILGFATAIQMLRPVLSKPMSVLDLPVMQWVPPLLLLPILAFLCLYSKDLASPGPDLTLDILTLVLLLALTRIMGIRRQEESVPLPLVSLATILSATAITIKLSGIATGLLIAGLAVVFAFLGSKTSWKAAAQLLLPPALILLVWMIRGIITSGVPLFPSTIGYLPTDWSMPPEAIAAEANTIYGWARTPWVPYQEVLGNWDWLGGWIHRQLHFTMEIVYPVAVFVVLVLASICLTVFRRRRSPLTSPAPWLPLAPVLAGLIFWFFTAPDPRFARALILLLPVVAALPLAGIIQEKFAGRTAIVLLGSLFLVINFHYIGWISRHPATLFTISYEGWHPVKKVPLVVRKTHSGLAVQVPADTDETRSWDADCWDAPLPCTPVFTENLELRREGDLGRGFRVRSRPVNEK